MSNLERHPCLPTVEAVANGATFFSDHLPIVSSIPIAEGVTSNMLSLNTLGAGAVSGLHPAGAIWETEEQAKLRYARIADGLALAATQQNLDIIALQEVNPELMIDSLTEKLGSDWAVIPNTMGMITCYRQSQYTLRGTAEEPGPANEQVRRLSLQHVTNEQSVIIYNIWGFYRPFPRLTEQYFNQLLSSHGQNHIYVILSDSNSRVAPFHNMPENITTGVIPLTFNRANEAPDGVQTTDYPDVIFYKDLAGYIHQASHSVINLATGEKSEDSRSREEADPWLEYRMIMCLDHRYHTTPVINGHTLFSYEAALQKLHGSDLIQCRVAADSFNDKAIGLRLVSRAPFTQYIRDKLISLPGVQTKFIQSTETQGPEASRPFPCIMVPYAQVGLLHRAIIEDPETLSGQILSALKTDYLPLFEKEGSRKAEALKDLIESIYRSLPGAFSLLNTIKDWQKKYLETNDSASNLTPSSFLLFFNNTRETNWKTRLDLLNDSLTTISSAAETEAARPISWSPQVNAPLPAIPSSSSSLDPQSSASLIPTSSSSSDPQSSTHLTPVSSSSSTQQPANSPTELVSSPEIKLPAQPFKLPEAPVKSSGLSWSPSFMKGCSSGWRANLEEDEIRTAEALRNGLNTAMRSCGFDRTNSSVVEARRVLWSSEHLKQYSLKDRCDAVKKLLETLWNDATTQFEADLPRYNKQKQFCLNFLAILSAQEVRESSFASMLDAFEKRTTSSATSQHAMSPSSSSS